MSPLEKRIAVATERKSCSTDEGALTLRDEVSVGSSKVIGLFYEEELKTRVGESEGLPYSFLKNNEKTFVV